MFRYYLPNKIFVNAGPAAGVLVSDEQTKTSSGGQISAIYDDLRKFSIGVAGGAGYQTRNFGIEARYEMNNGYSTYSGRINRFNIITALVSYSF